MHRHAWIEWALPEARLFVGWRNRERITENAAYGVSLAVFEGLYDTFAVADTATKSGADFYVAPPGASRASMEEWLRLEVAGLDRGNESDLRRKVDQKVQQVRDGQCDLPGIVCVVGFAARLILIEDVWP